MTKVGELLKFRDAGPSVEEARRAMLAAGEGPGSALKPVVDAGGLAPVVQVAPEEDFEDDIPPAVAPAVAAPVAAQPPATAPTTHSERVENDQFIGEVSQENGKWVAKLTYKKGGGTERFEAPSRTGLMMQLLQGKGNATLRVKEAVRRERFGSPNVDVYYPLPEGTSAEDFDKMTEGQQKALIYTVAQAQTIEFRDAHPEFHLSPANSERIGEFLQSHKPKLPITRKNLEYAYSCLRDAEELEVKETISAKPMPAPAQTDPAPAAAVVPAAPAAVAPALAAVVVRKRGTTGLQPEHSSSPTEQVRAEAGGEPRQPSEAELRRMPLKELKRIADADRRARSGS